MLVIATASVTVIIISALYVLLSMLRLERKRHQSRQVLPREGELWTQDNLPMEILRANEHGVKVRVVDLSGSEVWQESWQDWQIRTTKRVVLRTGIVLNKPSP